MNESRKIHLVDTCQRSLTGVERTDDMAKVTCKTCLKFVNKRLQYPDVPTFQVVGEDARGKVRILRFTCPICGQVNKHSGKYGRSGDGDGHRSSHCRCWRPNGYHIKEIIT